MTTLLLINIKALVGCESLFVCLWWMCRRELTTKNIGRWESNFRTFMLVMHRGTFSRDRPDVQGATIELKVNYVLVVHQKFSKTAPTIS